MLGHSNARVVAPKLENVLFWGTAKFFAGFAKGAALELCGGTETARGALPQRRPKERKAERAQVPGATGVGWSGAKYIRRKEEYR